MDLVKDTLAGKRLALARLLTQVENDTPLGREALNRLFPYTGRAHLIGVTGSPGTGKSSLVCRLVKAFRGETGGPKVAVIAVDPTSPFSGGALLGDRVRMRDLFGDEGVFIRSMASRGALGGLSHTTAAVAQVLDAAGYEYILIETVGAGQSEVDIARLAQTVLVVESPGLGDDIQAIKAGILEVADILIVNKSDLPGADQAARALQSMIELSYPNRLARGSETEKLAKSLEGIEPKLGGELLMRALTWEPPVLKASTPLGEGVEEIIQAIHDHRCYLESSGEWQNRDAARLQTGLEALIQATLVARWRANLPAEKYREVLARLAERKLSPYEAVEQLLP